MPGFAKETDQAVVRVLVTDQRALAVGIGLDVARPANGRRAEPRERDYLVINAANCAPGRYEKVHDSSYLARRRIFRLGRSIINPSISDCTAESCVATLCRSSWLLRSRFRLDAAHDPLCLLHQIVELLAGADVKVAKPFEELMQVVNGRVPKNFGLSILCTAEAVSQVGNQFGQLVEKRLLG